MRMICIIPARLGSTRLPNKMLSDIQGSPLIQHTYRNASQCRDFDKVVVATDSDSIAQTVHEIGGETLMPEGDFETGTDRVAAAARQYPEMDVVVNLQGDEPFVTSSMLSELVRPYREGESPEMATLANPLDWEKDYNNPNMVKVLLDQQGYAIYFSRSPIPYLRQQASNLPVLHHMGIYAFQSRFLQNYAQLPQTPLETAESLEQLRALENGYNIRVSQTAERALEINYPEDLQNAQRVPLSD